MLHKNRDHQSAVLGGSQDKPCFVLNRLTAHVGHIRLVGIKLYRLNIAFAAFGTVFHATNELTTGGVDIFTAGRSDRGVVIQIVQPLLKTHDLVARWLFVP